MLGDVVLQGFCYRAPPTSFSSGCLMSHGLVGSSRSALVHRAAQVYAPGTAQGPAQLRGVDVPTMAACLGVYLASPWASDTHERHTPLSRRCLSRSHVASLGCAAELARVHSRSSFVPHFIVRIDLRLVQTLHLREHAPLVAHNLCIGHMAYLFMFDGSGHHREHADASTIGVLCARVVRGCCHRGFAGKPVGIALLFPFSVSHVRGRALFESLPSRCGLSSLFLGHRAPYLRPNMFRPKGLLLSCHPALVVSVPKRDITLDDVESSFPGPFIRPLSRT